MEIELYKRTLEDAKAEMGLLLQQRRVIEERISMLAPVIEYLSPLCDQVPPSFPPDLPMPSQLDTGLSDAIRLAFKSVLPASLTPTEVRDKLRESGFNLDKYANELPPIHNTIMRLLKQGEIEEDVPRREGKTYRWVSSLKRALLEIDPVYSSGMRGNEKPPANHPVVDGKIVLKDPQRLADLVRKTKTTGTVAVPGGESPADEDSLVDQVRKSFGKNVEGSK